MQLTIDSAEPLEHVLRVVGSLYGTELAMAPTGTVVQAPKANARAARSSKGTAKPRVSKNKRARARTAPTSDVRVWARKQGYEIRNRGPIAVEILRAYTAAHK